MDQFIPILELQRHSFIVRFWLEEASRHCDSTWRGSVTHVPSGECRYVSDLDEISSFMAKYLSQMGAVVESRRYKNWLRWLRRKTRQVRIFFFF